MPTFRPFSLLAWCLVLSCASNQKIYGGTELEGSDEGKSGDLNMTGVAGGTNSTVSTKDQSDLGASFEPEPSHEESDSDSEGDEAPPPPARAPTVRDQKEEAFEARRQQGLKRAYLPGASITRIDVFTFEILVDEQTAQGNCTCSQPCSPPGSSSPISTGPRSRPRSG